MATVMVMMVMMMMLMMMMFIMLMMLVMMMMVVVMMMMIRTSACLTSLLNKNLSCGCMTRGAVAAVLRPRAPGVNVVSCRLDCDGQVIRPGKDQH